MKLAFVSNLFPNAREPQRGIFNAQQVAALARVCTITKVIAPHEKALPDEMRGGLPVLHPRFLHIPVVTRPWNGWLFSRALAPHLRHRDFDCVLVNWAYPDAYAVMLLARRYGFPFAATVQGSDVNVLFQNPCRKRQILEALRASVAVFTRSDALRHRLDGEGIKATTVYNGVDRQKFQPQDRAAACITLGLRPELRRIVYIGNLQTVKGPTVLATAFEQLKDLPDVELIFVGAGPEAAKIAATDRVRLLGSQPHDKIPLWLSAADVVCLPSFNEGLPNIAIEAAACGRPIVASRVGGVPEVVADGRSGLLVPAGDPVALAGALREALARNWDSSEIRQAVKHFDWERNAQTVVAVLNRVVAS